MFPERSVAASAFRGGAGDRRVARVADRLTGDVLARSVRERRPRSHASARPGAAPPVEAGT